MAKGPQDVSNTAVDSSLKKGESAVLMNKIENPLNFPVLQTLINKRTKHQLQKPSQIIKKKNPIQKL